MKHHQLVAKYVTNRLPHRSWTLPGGIFLGLFIAGCLLFAVLPKKYTARATIEIQPRKEIGAGASGFSFFRGGSHRYFDTQAVVINSDGFLRKFAGQAGLAQRWGTSNAKTWKILDRSTKVSRRGRSTNLIDIYFTSSNAVEAVDIANAIGSAYLVYWKNLHSDRYEERIRQAQLEYTKLNASASAKSDAYRMLESEQASGEELITAKRDWLNFESMSSMLEKRLEQIRLEKIIVATSARISEKADFDTIARGPGLGAGYFLILTLSLLGTVLTVGVMYALQKRKKSIASIAKAVAPPSLTVLTENLNEVPDHSASFEKLRSEILGAHAGNQGVMITAVSCLVNESASDISYQLAKSLANGGSATLLVDGNLRQPTIQEEFQASHQPGFSDFLVGAMQLPETVIKSPHENLWFMPGGNIPENSTELFNEAALGYFQAETRSRFDFIIVNSPPLMSSVDSLILIGESDMTFLNTEVGKAPYEVLTRARRAIEQAGGTMSGLILKQVKESDEVEIRTVDLLKGVKDAISEVAHLKK